MAFGLNQINNPTPKSATMFFRIVLYVCALGNLAITIFTTIPDHTKVLIAGICSFATIAVHLASKMFGVPLPEDAEVKVKDVQSLKTDTPQVQ